MSVIIRLLGSVLVSMIFFAGVLFSDALLASAILMTFGAVGLGVLFAALQYGPKVTPVMTAKQLVMAARIMSDDDHAVYLACPELMPLGNFFHCQVNGQRALVLEAREHGDHTDTTAADPS